MREKNVRENIKKKYIFLTCRVIYLKEGI